MTNKSTFTATVAWMTLFLATFANASTDEQRKEFASKMAPNQLMCAQGICVTEDDLYRERGPMLYSLEDKLYFQKYEMAKNLILQKIIEKKLAGTNQTFADYHKQVTDQIKVSDDDVKAFLKNLKINEITPDTPQFYELKNKLMAEKIQNHYKKILDEYKGKSSYQVFMKMNPRQKADTQQDQLIAFKTEKNDDLRITLVINPSLPSQRTLIESVESVAQHLNNQGKKISWYFLPYTNDSSEQNNYEKMMICSMKLDHGKSYKEILEIGKIMESESKFFELLKKRKYKTEPLQNCFNHKETASKIAKMKQFINTSKLDPIPQIIYNNEVEYRIPGMLELKDRVEQKLKIKALLKKDSVQKI